MKSPTTYLTRVTQACGNHVTRAQQLCNLWKKYIYKTLKSKYHALMNDALVHKRVEIGAIPKSRCISISVLLITLVSCLKSGWNTRTRVHLSSFVLYCSFCNILCNCYSLLLKNQWLNTLTAAATFNPDDAPTKNPSSWSKKNVCIQQKENKNSVWRNITHKVRLQKCFNSQKRSHFIWPL